MSEHARILRTGCDSSAGPRNEDRRNAILKATTELVAKQGLGAPTAAIANRAGIPHGSIFTYFKTETDLLNVLYVDLSREMTDTVLATMPPGNNIRAQFHHLCESWMFSGAANLSKRRVQTLLNVSDLVTEQNRNTLPPHVLLGSDAIQLDHQAEQVRAGRRTVGKPSVRRSTWPPLARFRRCRQPGALNSKPPTGSSTMQTITKHLINER